MEENEENIEDNNDYLKIKPVKTYQVDWDKVNTIDDLKCVFKGLRLTLFVNDDTETGQFMELFEKGLLIEK